MLLLVLLMVSSVLPARGIVGMNRSNVLQHTSNTVSRARLSLTLIYIMVRLLNEVSTLLYMHTQAARHDHPFQEMERKRSHGQSTQRPNERGSN